MTPEPLTNPQIAPVARAGRAGDQHDDHARQLCPRTCGTAGVQQRRARQTREDVNPRDRQVDSASHDNDGRPDRHDREERCIFGQCQQPVDIQEFVADDQILFPGLRVAQTPLG